MLRLVLFRHAKSCWSNSDLSDFERPLNERGRTDAPRMATKLKPLLKEKTLLISSPACRAAATARLAAAEWKIPNTSINYKANLYHASLDEIWQVILQQEQAHTTLVIFGHNEGLTELATICSRSAIDHLPTAGVAVFDFECSMWSQIEQHKAQLIDFNYPKKA